MEIMSTPAQPTRLTSRDLCVFEGASSVRDFLDPDNNPPLPLVELPDDLNLLRGEGVRIFAKIMYLLPLLNIKSLPAMNMLLEAESSGKLTGVHTVIENSSGNTAFSLAVLARYFGVSQVTAIVPWDIAPGKLDLLRLSGAQPTLKKEVPNEPSGIAEARQAGKREGYFNPGQYENEANPKAYERWMAPQISKQTNGKLTVFAAGLGTTGTLIGASRYLRREHPKIKIIGSILPPDGAVPGVRSEARLREVAFEWRNFADSLIEVGTKESYKVSLTLCRAGFMAGPSSGFALAGLNRFLYAQCEQGRLDEIRNDEGEVLCVFVCCDTPLPYLDKYSTHLDASEF
jgi:cysteine synthase